MFETGELISHGKMQNGVLVAQDGVLILPCFKEGFMNKKIVVVSILMLMVCSIAFSQNRDANQLATDARTALSTAKSARDRALGNSNATVVLQEMNRIYAEYERISTRFNNLTNRGIEITGNNAQEIGRATDKIQEYFNEVKNHHQRLLTH
jgi:peptidoglycan hydrolase CwlO-like protein